MFAVISLLLTYFYAPSGTTANPINSGTANSLKVKTIACELIYIVCGILFSGLRTFLLIGILSVVVAVLPCMNKKYQI